MLYQLSYARTFLQSVVNASFADGYACAASRRALQQSHHADSNRGPHHYE